MLRRQRRPGWLYRWIERAACRSMDPVGDRQQRKKIRIGSVQPAGAVEAADRAVTAIEAEEVLQPVDFTDNVSDERLRLFRIAVQDDLRRRAESCPTLSCSRRLSRGTANLLNLGSLPSPCFAVSPAT